MVDFLNLQLEVVTIKKKQDKTSVMWTEIILNISYWRYIESYAVLLFLGMKGKWRSRKGPQRRFMDKNKKGHEVGRGGNGSRFAVPNPEENSQKLKKTVSFKGLDSVWNADYCSNTWTYQHAKVAKANQSVWLCVSIITAELQMQPYLLKLCGVNCPPYS